MRGGGMASKDRRAWMILQEVAALLRAVGVGDFIGDPDYAAFE